MASTAPNRDDVENESRAERLCEWSCIASVEDVEWGGVEGLPDYLLSVVGELK